MKTAHQTARWLYESQFALASLQEPETDECRYRPADDELMRFLQAK